jgi:hypothetical protein
MKTTASVLRNWAYSSRSQTRPAAIPCSGSKSTNNATKPAALNRAHTRSVVARS